MEQLHQIIEVTWNNREMLKTTEVQKNIRKVVDWLDMGTLRIAQPNGNSWQINECIKKAVILYFPIQKMETTEVIISMPSFVNIGAYVGNGTMIDTWVTVGSCAHIIGKRKERTNKKTSLNHTLREYDVPVKIFFSKIDYIYKLI